MRQNVPLTLNAEALREYGSRVAETHHPAVMRTVDPEIDVELVIDTLGIELVRLTPGENRPALIVQTRYNTETGHRFDIRQFNLDLSMMGSRRRRALLAQAVGLFFVLHVYPEQDTQDAVTEDNSYRVEYHLTEGQPEYSQSREDHATILTQANCFASGLLMPEEPFVAQAHQFLAQVDTSEVNSVVYTLARIFNVSPRAARQRFRGLVNMGLIHLSE